MVRIIFAVFDGAGGLLSGILPSVLLRKITPGAPSGNSAPMPTPAVSELGGGFYEFSVDPSLVPLGAYLVDCGELASSRFLFGNVGSLVVFPMYDSSGNLDSGRLPTFSLYSTSEGPLSAHPSLMNFTGGLYGFVPENELGQLVYYLVGDSLNKSWGTIGSTSVSSPAPLPGTSISQTQVISFDVIDAETELGRVLIAVKYPNFGGATELVWDGEAAVGPHLVTRTAIPGGWRYALLRSGGWPGPPTVRVFVTNFGGREI